MTDSPPRHESADNQGTTSQSSGTVGVTPINIPSVAGTPISEFLIVCPEDQDIDNRLLISIDGVNFMTLHPTGNLGWTPKGESVTQLTIKGNQAGVKYEIIYNREPD